MPSRDEAGVVTVVMTLAVSTFLLGVAALAVDLGQAYLRQNDLQSLADRLTLAGARGLPSVEDAVGQVGATLTAVCGNHEEELCPPPSPTVWTDSDLANGEIAFFTDPDADGVISVADAVVSPATPSVALRVLLPPSTVRFGLAGALGFDSATIQASATARIGTALGSGLLPFVLTPDDLTAGRFCVTTTAADPDPDGPVHLSLNTPYPQGVPAEGGTARFTLSSPARTVTFHLTTADGRELTLPSHRSGWGSYRVALPPGTAGGVVRVRATGRQRSFAAPGFTTNHIVLTYTGTPPPTEPDPTAQPSQTSSSACTEPQDTRGFADLTRPGVTDPIAALEQNIRSGTGAGIPRSLRTVTGSDFSDALTRGLLAPDGNRPGRLISRADGSGEVDPTDLFTTPGLLDPRYAGPVPLRTLLEQGRPATAANRGWITAAAVRSRRLAVLPVVDPDPVNGENTFSVTTFRYVWIDSLARDPHDANRLTGFGGPVVDPGYLPEVVSGSGVVGPFLGSGLPREAVLVRDLDGTR